MAHLIEVKDAYKIYNPGENEVRALDGVSLTVDPGESSWLSSASRDRENLP